MKLRLILYTFIFSITITSCGTWKKAYVEADDKGGIDVQLPEEEKIETLYLLGDAGANENPIKQAVLFKSLRQEIKKAGEGGSLVFLGDNIYPAGLPTEDDPDREVSESYLNKQLEIVRDTECKTYMIPGNHDWNRMSPGGLAAVKREEDYVQDYYEGQDVHFYPNNACGDPVVKKIDKDLYYIFIDSQWWLENWDDEKGINKGCHIKSRQEFLQEMEAIFLKHKNDQLVVLMHHPLYSNGEHGGEFAPKYHLFPLTYLFPKLYIPLPILGSIMPLYRSMTGDRQDIPSTIYQELKNGLLDLLAQNKNVIFAAGHEHSLQYFQDKKQHFVVSGSGSKIVFAKGSREARFVRSAMGYSRVHFYKNGSVWLDFMGVEEGATEATLLYRKEIVQQRAGTLHIEETKYPQASELPDSITYTPGTQFVAGGFKRFMMGDQYRDMWTTPVTVPIINLATEKGGLTPIKKGGGMASNSLRLEAEDGTQYALRSVLKDYSKLVDPGLANLKVIDLFSDTNSASHPYGALVLPALSKAANIYYTIPKLVYLQRQEELGDYNDLFQEELYLLEDRPAGNRENDPNLGNSKEIISYLDLLARIKEDDQLKIDEQWTVRSRLFDIWIHDWDRHDDQWRWAKIKEDGKEFYRPIPRDRDQAFYRFDGVVPKTVSTLAIFKFKEMKEDLKSVKWQSFNARYFDRYFLHQLEWEDWEKEVRYLQENLTDEVIEQALKDLPAEVYSANHEELERLLKSRRDHLEEIARKLYLYIGKAVSIPGSDKAQKFEVERLDNGDLKVEMFNLTKKGKKKNKCYERTFKQGETKEVRLYGLGGKDEFRVKGKSKKSIKVRIIGGFGDDKIDDTSRVPSFRNKTIVYDDSDGIKIKSEGEVRDMTGPDLEENDYNRKDHLYDTNPILPLIGYTRDDRLWLGASLNLTQHGFRKHPYRDRQFFRFTFSPTTRNAFQFHYTGEFNNWIFKTFDFQPSLTLSQPHYVNYYGLGNNSVNNSDDIRFNWVRMHNYEAHLFATRTSNEGRYHFFIGPRFHSWGVRNVEGRVLDQPEFAVAETDLERRNFLGGVTGFRIKNIDHPVFTSKGFVTNIEYGYFGNLDGGEVFSQFKAEQKIYLTFGNHVGCTFANRTGYQRTQGDLAFYQYASLGNNNFLRGFRNDRFRGNEIFYNNFDMRIQFASSNNQILPFEMGVLAGYDIGRVWLDGEDFDGLHHSVTGGLWFNVLDFFILNPHVSFSEEETLFNFLVGFSF